MPKIYWKFRQKAQEKRKVSLGKTFLKEQVIYCKKRLCLCPLVGQILHPATFD
jgi:hypothetical protein